MKKAILVGGSNGIGLAVACHLIDKGYHVNILDKQRPDEFIFENTLTNNQSSYTYYPCNLIDFDERLFKEQIEDKDVELLMITAGIGRVADFEYLHPTEIENWLKVNTIATIKIVRFFYDRIKSKKTFYCGLMGSIAGLVSSPMFSVYAASKAAICRFAESINIELEQGGYTNRILNVSPGSIKGTKFNGGINDIKQLNNLASEIITHLMASDELFIPDYEKTYKKVLENYMSDSHAFGLNSYQYKIASGRAINKPCVQIGYLSGTFDLFHVGHLNLLKHAKEHCDYLIVGVHPDASHKGKETFISFDERMEIVEGCKYVDKVVASCKEDNDAWKIWNYSKLFVGSDYKGTERFKRYEDFFRDKNVEILYLPYTKETNSTQIRKTILLKTKDILFDNN